MILPPPSDFFAWVHNAGALACRPFHAIAQHLFTTRQWRLGTSGIDSDDPEGWRDVAAALSADTNQLVRAHQVHGFDVVVGQRGMTKPDADILIGSEPGLVLAVQAADCVPLLMVDACTGVAAAAHAGWKGLAARVPSITVQALATHFGSKPADLRVALGPSIGACCYEVGPDVRASFVRNGFSESEMCRWFLDAPPTIPLNASRLRGSQVLDRQYFDGWACVRDQLTEAGVTSEHIWSSGLCTASHPEVFCSFRRDGPKAGRMVAAVRIGAVRP